MPGLPAGMELLVVGDYTKAGYFELRYDNAYCLCAQSFVATHNYYVTHVQIPLWKVGTPTGNCWVEIHSSQDGTSATKNASTNIVGQGSADVAIASLSTSKEWVIFTFSGTIPELEKYSTYYIVLYADCAVSTSNYLRNTVDIVTGNFYGYKIDNTLSWSLIGGNFDLVCILNGYFFFTETVKVADSYLGSVGILTNYEYYLAGNTGAIYEYSLDYKGDAGSSIVCTWVGANRDFIDQGAKPDTFKTVYSAKLTYHDLFNPLHAGTLVDVYISTDDGRTWTTSPTGTKTLGWGMGEVRTATWHFPGGITSQYFKPKIVSTSTTTRPRWLALELGYIERGEHFDINPINAFGF